MNAMEIENGPAQGGAQPAQQALQGHLDCFVKVAAAVLIGMATVGMFLMWQTGPAEEPVVALWCKPNATVSLGGHGDFSTISDAVRSAPSFSSTRFCIHIKGGRYVENVVVEYDKTNVVFLGDGFQKTVIVANRTCGSYHCELQLATLSVKGTGFIAVDLTVENNEEPVELATAAVEILADRTIFYRCRLIGRHGVVRAVGLWQFYRDTLIQGAGSLIYGRARAYFQRCTIAIDGSVRNVIYSIAESSPDLPAFGGAFTFHLCDITAKGGPLTSTPVLGSAITPNGRVAYLESRIDIQGVWATNGFGPGRLFFSEFANTGVGADNISSPVDEFQLLDVSGASQLSLRNYFDEFWLPADVPQNLDLGS